MSTASNLERKLQQSVINWIAATATHSITLGITARHFEEDDSDTRTLPAVVVRAVREREHPIGSGNFWLNCEVTLYVQAHDTSESDQSDYWSRLVSILLWDQLAARLSDLTAFTCDGVLHESGSDKVFQDTHWEHTYVFRALCYPS